MTELDGNTFAETIKSSDPVVVDFWAGWCMPCKMFAPVLQELSDELDGKAHFCKLDIDENGDLAQKYAITSIPTLLIFKNGELMDRMVGVRPKDEVVTTISKYF